MIRLLLVITLALTGAKNTFQIEGKVTVVHDGNTLDVSASDGQLFRIVLSGIDCPELEQDSGIDAKILLQKMTLNKEVVVLIYGKDRLKNYIGVVMLKDSTDVRIPLLEQGLAWTSEKDPVPELELIRTEAMTRRRGLWKQDDALAPWLFRRQQSMIAPKSR